MEKTYICSECGMPFKNNKVLANHIRWNHRTHYSEKGLEKQKALKVERVVKELICNKCGKLFKKSLTLSEWKRREKSKEFCSISCANSRGPRSAEFKKAVSLKLSKALENKECPVCGKDFKHKSRKFCSKECGHLSRVKCNKSLTEYRRRCSFNFNLHDFPTEFNFSLIENHGWYKAKNHGNNLTGVSRDHMVSIKYGFDNSINHKIISHPANCRLMQHGENSKKNSNCSITYEELLERIEKWNKKYK